MNSEMESCNLAVLIEADNAERTIVDGLLAQVGEHGTANVRRIYGDWTNYRLKGWKNVLNEHSIQPVQPFAYTTGKNATDSAMIIDAMDLLYTGNVDGWAQLGPVGSNVSRQSPEFDSRNQGYRKLKSISNANPVRTDFKPSTRGALRCHG